MSATEIGSFTPDQIVTVTDSAAKHFAEQLKRTGKPAIRISLKESGCTGLMYVIEEVDSAEEKDVSVSLENGVPLFVDVTHLGALQGTVVDYRLEGVNKNLIMENPNVKNSCGCGESFNV